MLVIQPIGGKDDWEALFHEAGHTEHYAHTSGDLPMEDARLGDMAVTEGWARARASRHRHRLAQPSTRRPAACATWRTTAPSRCSTSSGATAAKLLYEIEFFQADDLPSMRPRYFELLSDALKLPVNPESYLDDIDGSFYVIGYLRSWAFEAQLREFLRSEFGNEWFARREAGDLLRELWSLGQGPTADELLKDVTGAKLEMASVADASAKAFPKRSISDRTGPASARMTRVHRWRDPAAEIVKGEAHAQAGIRPRGGGSGDARPRGRVAARTRSELCEGLEPP